MFAWYGVYPNLVSIIVCLILTFVVQVHNLMWNYLVLLLGMAWCFLLFLPLFCRPHLPIFRAVKKVFDLLSYNVKSLKIFSRIQQANIHVNYRKLIFLIKCDVNRKKKRMSFFKMLLT